MKKLIFKAVLMSLTVTLIFNGCKHSPDELAGPSNPNIEPPIDTLVCDSSNVSYTGTVSPILDAYCISCHSGPTPSGALDFTDYSDVAFVAQSGQLLGSLKHLDGFEPMPQNGDKLSNCEIALIEKWINDTTFIIPPDTTDCDTSFVTYPGTIYPIFQANCISCHGPPQPQGGLDFTDFSDVAFVAQSGQLLGAIKQLPDYEPMPQNAPPLTECEIILIEKWINDTTFNQGGGGIPCDPDTIYFQNDVLPLLQSSCGVAGCHDQQSAQDGVILTSYQAVMQTAGVVPFDPLESEIYEVITENDPDKRMPPPPSAPLNTDQINLIYKWIAQGALNNYCEQEECDSLNVTFSGTVFPIIQNNCYGCHSGSNPGGGISLTNYNQVKAQASIPVGSPGSLLGAITWANGNIPMPQNGSQLSECNIAQIRKWINDGMPDN
jgi:mono/diheme cytochrome c family protein